MSSVLGIAFEPERAGLRAPGLDALEVLAVEGWAPEGAALCMARAPWRWWGAVEAVEQAASGADAIILFARSPDPHVALTSSTASNAARPGARDAVGAEWPGPWLSPGGAPWLQSPLSSERLARAIAFAGAPAQLDTPGAACVANRCLYWLMSRRPATPVALVRLPSPDEGGYSAQQALLAAAVALSFAAAAAEPTLVRTKDFTLPDQVLAQVG